MRRPQPVEPNKIDPLPPHSIDAEQGVVGCCLLSRESIDTVLELKGQPAWCYDLRHQQILEAVFTMHSELKPIDLITVQQYLKDRKQLEAVGGLTYLSSLQDAVPSASNLSYYLDIVREKFALRRLIQESTETVARVHDCTDMEAVLESAERRILLVREEIETGRGVSDVRAALSRIQDKIDQVEVTGQPAMGLPTGFEELDRRLGGLKDGEAAFFGGTPASGKTTLFLNIMANCVFNLNEPAGMFSYETSTEDVLHRIICARAQVDGARILRGDADMVEKEAYVLAHGDVAQREKLLLICNDGSRSSRQMLAKARKMKQQGAKLIGIDYLQLIKERGETRTERLEAASMGCQLIANETGLPVVIISSLNNEVGKDEKRPTLFDMKGSGQMAYDAGKVLLLHSEEPEKTLRKVEVNIAKNKGGAQKVRVYLTLHAPQYRFEPRAFDAD